VIFLRLNVAYSSDDNYARHLGVSMISLFKNNISFDEIYVYIIENNISSTNKKKLNKIADEYERNIIYIPFKELCSDLKTNNNFPLSAYARLFLARIDDIEKIIYLDCDSIICDSFIELWKKDISDYYVAGVQDNVNQFYKLSIGLDKNFRYINSGFLLINIEKWRLHDLERKFMDFIAKHKGDVPHHDQGTINAVCKNSILLLHPRYNVLPPMFQFSRKEIMKLDNVNSYYSKEEINEAKQDPCFIHFTNSFFNRPWNENSTHPLKNIYLNYLNQSPWRGEIEDNKLNRNTRIMKTFYKYLPFYIYLFIDRLRILKKKLVN